MEDRKNFWDYLNTLTRAQIIEMAEQELLDIKGLTAVRKILHKYNLTNVTMDNRMKFAFKKSIDYCPRKDFEKEQGEG